MNKTAVSLTLKPENLVWLRGRALSTHARSLSEALDHLITFARLNGATPPGAVRSVVGTLDIAADDPGLAHADDQVRAIVDASILAHRPARKPRRG